ncbi:hypothetical protein FACS1894189_0770 [Planctomycetales bacterium]|nr:hypothetical protein FACS1894189_0770 [Planctomycetales bacterium]
MNKQLSTFFSAVVLITATIFCGIGLHHTVTEYWNPPTLVSVATEQPAISNIPLTPKASAEFITGPLTANTGELCVFKLNDTTAKADWVIVPSATAYIDSSGSSLAFSSNVPAKYTIIAAIVEDGQPKILTHVCEYGILPNPQPPPLPKPNPTPPATLKDWVTQNVPAEGKTQATALADCYESVADSINKETIKTADAAFALLRSAAQTKIKTDVWKPFLDELSVKVTESINGSTDIKTLSLIFSEIAADLKTAQEDFAEIESRYIPDEVKREVLRRDGGQCLCCGIKSDLEYDHIDPYSKGGQNTADNLQLLCRRCNASKNTGTHCRIHGKDLSLKP